MSRSVAGTAWPWIRRILLIVGGSYLALGVLAWIFQRRLIYFPDGGPVPVPKGGVFADLQEIELTTADGVKLSAWYLPGEKDATVLCFHGNAGHRGHRLGQMEALHQLGYGVLLPDYRGYGGSGGEPSEDGFYEDAEACHAWLEEHTPGPLVYMGTSIGSGVAIELARRHPPAALIVRSGFTSLGDVGQRAYPFFPVRLFLRERYASVEKIGAIRCPFLAVHGGRDRVIPAQIGRELFEAANEPKQWLEVPGADHNDLELLAGRSYWDTIGYFLGTHLR